MYNCLIVDDEPNAHAVLKHYIAMDAELQLTAQAYNAAEAKSVLEKQNIDIIFLDINMPEITGIQLLQTNNIKACVILTTAYSEFALEGFDLGVTDYLLKPIPQNRFEAAVQKAKKLLQVENLDRFIMFKINGLNTKFLYSDILYFESVGNYIKIHTVTKPHLIIGTLTELESSLHQNYFVRIHKSYIVNTKLATLQSNKNAVQIKEASLPIGRTYKPIIINLFGGK